MMAVTLGYAGAGHGSTLGRSGVFLAGVLSHRQRYSVASRASVLTQESEGIVREIEEGRCPKPDGVVVLGGGLWRSNESPWGEIPPWAVRRLDGAAEVYRRGKADRIMICGGGSPHGLPMLHPTTGQVVHEGTAYAEYLIGEHHVPARDVLKEVSSYDTVGNGYFSAMIHAIPSGWKSAAVVTSEFHMPRSKAIFQKVYALVEASLGVSVSLSFITVRDDGLFSENSDALEVRRQKEMKSMETWEKNTSHMTTLEEFHAWMYATHVCYSCSKQDQFGIEDGSLKGTY